MHDNTENTDLLIQDYVIDTDNYENLKYLDQKMSKKYIQESLVNYGRFFSDNNQCMPDHD